MSTEDYHNKIKVVLIEPVCMKLKKDPTSTIERRTSSLNKMVDIPDDTTSVPSRAVFLNLCETAAR
jgi:hypothetical protein